MGPRRIKCWYNFQSLNPGKRFHAAMNNIHDAISRSERLMAFELIVHQACLERGLVAGIGEVQQFLGYQFAKRFEVNGQRAVR